MKISRKTMMYCIKRLEQRKDCKTAALILKQDLKHMELYTYYRSKIKKENKNVKF